MVTDVLAAARDLVAGGGRGAAATVVAGPGTGERALYDGDGAVIAGALPDQVGGDVAAAVRRLVPVEGAETIEVAGRRVFVESVGPPPLLVVVGATDIGAAVSVVAKASGFRVVVVDPRAAFAVEDRFPAAERVICAWPDTVIDDLGIDAAAHVVVLSHDERIEGPLLPKLLSSPARYLGVMGSRRTHAARMERLAEQGFDGDAVESRLHGPVGLDLGGGTPGEMAVAIVAEMILARRRPGVGHGRSVVPSPNPQGPGAPPRGTGAAR